MAISFIDRRRKIKNRWIALAELTRAGRSYGKAGLKTEENERMNMMGSDNNSGEHLYGIREVVAIFDSADALENAIEQLEIAGIDRAAISVMASKDAIDSKMGHVFRPVTESADADDVSRGVDVSRYEMAEATGALLSVPVYIGATAGLVAVFATGGALGLALAVGLAGAAAGGGFGALVARALGKDHAKHLEAQLEEGGLLLWVRVTDEADETQKKELLEKLGGRNVHAHLYDEKWGVEEVPLHDANPDPFLEEGD